MSVENLKEYARLCANDPEIREKAKAIGGTDVEEHMRLAESLGLNWTSGDMMAFRKELVADDDLTDLSEEELEQVAGGAFSVTIAVGLAVGAAAGAAAATAATAVGVAAAGDGL